MPALLYFRSSLLLALFFTSVSSTILADLVDFEDIQLDGEKSAIVTFHNTEIVQHEYLIHVWEGFVLDDSFYSGEWSALYDGEQLHPSKSMILGEKNNTLVTQRFSVRRADDKEFYFCRVNVAEKLNSPASSDIGELTIVANYQIKKFIDGEFQTSDAKKTLIETLDNNKGYDQFNYDFGHSITSLEFIVVNNAMSTTHFFFDDLVLGLNSSCN